MTKENIWKKRWTEIQPWVAGVMVVLSSAWFADSVREGFEALRVCMGWSGWGFGLFYFVILVASVYWLFQTRKTLFQPRTRRLEENTQPEQRQHLVLFLSNLNPKFFKEDSQGIPEWLEISGDINKDLEAMKTLKEEDSFKKWQWEMPLRAIRHHIGTLQQVVLVCSEESMQQAHWFYNIAQRYPVFQDVKFMILLNVPSGPAQLDHYTGQKKELKDGWKFEEFNSQARAMRNLFDYFQNQGISEKQVMIDFTGGQKVTSVVALAITFNRDASAQYVQTNEPWNVIGYDVLLGTSDTGGVGI